MSLPPEVTVGEPKVTRTAHAMLVPWGLFARQYKLIQALEEVSIPQRSREHRPQTKLIEFLVAILSGCAYLRDISLGPHPLDHDQAVAEAWEQPAWAHYSGVSRTLSACTPETVEAIRAAIARFSSPFIDREVVLSLQKKGAIFYDGDLTGRPVANTSTTYPGAAFGWMDDAIHLGYQAAMVSMHSPTYGRVWLSVTPHPGNTVSCTQAEALVRAAEVRTGVRPLRRTDLLARCIHQRQEELRQTQERLYSQKTRSQEASQHFSQTAQEWRERLAEVAHLRELEPPQERSERPYSRLAKARRKVGVLWRRLRRRSKEWQRARQAVVRQEARVAELQAELAALEERHTRFVEENRTNRSPVRAIFRLDGGFGTGENMALLSEMGYEVYSKAYSNRVTQAVRRRVTAMSSWTRVGDNAEMVAWKDLRLDFCPYPLDVGLEHFYTGQKECYALLLHYGGEAVTEDLPGWFTFYNGRQTIEAGVKEGKHVFQVHHLKVRSEDGLAIQEEFSALAANLVRWAALWLHEQCPGARPPFDQPQASVKQMVRVAANTLALVFWQPEGNLLLKFDELSSFAGTELWIGQGGAFQLPLPLFKSDDFSTI
jgi:hypothetical protein